MENILRKLVAFPTVSGDAAAMHDLLEYVSDFLITRGMHVERYESRGYESLVATTRQGNKRPAVMLGAHADVVFADSSMFDMQTQNGKYVGRGVLDMKFALASYLLLVDQLQNSLENYDFGIMVTGDEETGGRNGVAKLLAEGYLPQVCLLPDGGENWQIQTASKGSLQFNISLLGKTAHGSRPWLGENALVKLLAVLDEIASHFPRHPHPDTNTITLSVINGGEAANQVPGRATMSIDIRTVNMAEHDRLRTLVFDICRAQQAVCELPVDAVPTSFDLKNRWIAPYAKHVYAVTGTKVHGSKTLGSSDARYFIPHDVPVISLYPTGGNLHADGEWIGIEALRHFHEITIRYVKEMALASVSSAAKPLAKLTAIR
jgi:acetylornithine deacetylase/succinyl-diaminopimelate desuccinylase-like protein